MTLYPHSHNTRIQADPQPEPWQLGSVLLDGKRPLFTRRELINLTSCAVLTLFVIGVLRELPTRYLLHAVIDVPIIAMGAVIAVALVRRAIEEEEL